MSRTNLFKIILGIAMCGVISLSEFTTLFAFGGKFDEQFYSDNYILHYRPDAQSCNAAVSTTSQPISGSTNSIIVPLDFNLGDNDATRAVELAKRMMQDYSLTDFQAAGVIGNFVVETGTERLSPDINEGDLTGGPPKFDGGYGWAQWTGGRQRSFIEFAVDRKYMESDKVSATDAANYAYLNEELASSESKTIPALKATKNLEEAVRAWEEVFERAGIPNNSKRIEEGKKVLAALEGTTPGTQTTSSSCGVGTADSVVSASITFDNVTFPLSGTKSVVKNPDIFNNNTTSRGGHPYTAYDIYATAGTNVVAFTDGVVRQLSTDKCGSAFIGIYNEKADVILSYMHLNSTINVKVGDTVAPGDRIGTVASVKEYPCVNVDHLHIDAEAGNVRDACSRESCSAEVKAKFRDIGKDLFTTYQALPE